MSKKEGGVLFNPILDQDVTAKDGISAIILVCLYEIGLTTLFFATDEKNIRLIGTLYSALFSLVLIFLHRTKLHTLGFRKVNEKMTLFVSITILFIAFLYNTKQIHENCVSVLDFLINAISFWIMMFCVEELIFRGYLWPRLIALCGKHMGTILCGTLFGIMHLISGMNYGDIKINIISVFNSISSGIVGQYWFCLLYSYSKNIFFPTTIHSSIHFFVVKVKFTDVLKLFNNIL